MKSDIELWRQMFSPTNATDALTELRHLLSTNDYFKTVLERFLFEEWCVALTKQRQHLDPVIRQEWQAYANSTAELAGRIFGEKNQLTTETLIKSV